MTAQDVIASPHLAKLTVKDFLVLSESGAFEKYARAELIEGEVWVVNAIHRRHARAHAVFVGELFAGLKIIGGNLQLYANPSTELSNISLPEPDVVVAVPEDSEMLAGPEVRLAVEISDSTLKMDLGRKARLYATHGVPEYWVVDVAAALVYQMWTPDGDTYRERREVRIGDRVTCATMPDLGVDTDQLR